MPQGKPPLLVLRSSDICFLGILRACKHADIPVVPITFTWPTAPVWYSELSTGFYDHREISNPFTDPDKAVKQLTAIFKSLSEQYQTKLMVLPSSDTNMMFLMDHFAHFEPFVVMMGNAAFSSPREDVIHKHAFSELLASNCPNLVPLTMRCSQAEHIQHVVENMIYPAVYKPAVKDYGQTFYQTHQGNKAILCDTPKELEKCLTEEMAAGFDLVVQEKLIFDTVYEEIPFYLYANSESRITMAGNGIKELIEPFPFGTAIILRFAWYPELLELAQEVVSALSYHGILMIEFLRDKKDNQWKVVEVNPRHWLFNGFYQRIGLNYSKALYDDMLESSNTDTELVTASSEVIEKNFTHVDLYAVAESWSRDNGDMTFDQYLSKLDAIEGSLSSVYLDPNDPAPGVERTSTILRQFQWPENGLDKILKRLAL